MRWSSPSKSMATGSGGFFSAGLFSSGFLPSAFPLPDALASLDFSSWSFPP